MKKGVLLNSDVSAVVSRLGHTDQIAICDAGLPIPAVTPRIDLALTQGVPTSTGCRCRDAGNAGRERHLGGRDCQA